MATEREGMRPTGMSVAPGSDTKVSGDINRMIPATEKPRGIVGQNG